MTYTFTTNVYDNNTGEQVYAEYHNFREFKDGFIYYRGGATITLEIDLTKEAALKAIDNLILNGWTIDKPKTIYIN